MIRKMVNYSKKWLGKKYYKMYMKYIAIKLERNPLVIAKNLHSL